MPEVLRFPAVLLALALFAGLVAGASQSTDFAVNSAQLDSDAGITQIDFVDTNNDFECRTACRANAVSAQSASRWLT